VKTKAVIITGLPGTGKTTLAKALSKATDWPHLNTDMIRDELGLRGQYDESTKARVYEELFHRLKHLLVKGEVVIDGTFYKRSLQERLAGVIADAGAEAVWVEATCSEDLIRERTSKKREYSEADFEVYLKIKADYHPLPSAFIVDTGNSHPLELAESLLNAISS
jgi:predicted kinase